MYPPKEQLYPPPPMTTGVPMHPPPPMQIQSQAQGPWSSGLCDCFDDCGNCCMTCWCPCITFGRIAEIVDRGSSSCGTSGALYALLMCVTGCHCIYSCFYRSRLRGQYSLHASPCNDCLVHCCCEHCALCQEYRELKRRGFDMHVGWPANLERQNVGARVPPELHEAMMR